jgi:hypothetical protein
MPPEVVRKPMKVTRQGATPQTVDLTPNTPTVSDADPYWTRDEQTIVFDSNRKDLPGTQVDSSGLRHVYRMRPDGSALQAVTGPLSSPTVGATASQTEPSVNPGTTALVYIETSTSGAVDLVEYNLNTNTARSILKSNPNGLTFTALNHPEYGFAPGGQGVGVIFAGRLSGQGVFKLFAVDTQSGQVTQLTQGISDDRNPTLSPDPNKPAVAFDSNRADSTGNTIKLTRDVWVMGINPTIQNAVRVTNFSAGGQASENIQPAWSTDKVDRPTQTIRGQQLIGFASTRYDTANDGNANGINPNGSHDIYWLKVTINIDPNNPSVYTVTTPEDTSNPAFKLTTSDPQHKYNDLRPTWPQFIATYRVAFQSDRTFYNPATNDSGPNGQPTDIFDSTLLDLNAPTLIRADDVTGDVLKIEPRSAVAGLPVKISVKLADFETGIRDVFVQIKNPNSKYQGSDNREHKVFLFANLPLDGNNTALDVPIEYESQRIFVGSDPTDARVNTYANPIYTASIDDFFAFSGAAHPPSPNGDPATNTPATGWLPLTLESRDPVTGVSTYSATWTTDRFPSDYYVDVIAYDNAVNPFAVGQNDPLRAVNWKIYDNVWGFTTKPFQSTKGVLFVSDYSAGQKFFSTRFGVTSLLNVSHTFWGTESWMTDIDVSLLPTRYINGTTIGALIDVRNTLGVKTYVDADSRDGTIIDGSDASAIQQYDIWRILSRGPLPDSVLSQYLPRLEQQPPDLLAGETAPRTVKVNPRCIIWNAPYTGNLFTGPGTLTDLQVQNQLHNFLQAGGRLLVSGQDIGWALTLAGTTANSFMANDLRAQFVRDDAGATFFRIGSGGIPLFYGITGAYALTASGSPNPITFDPYLSLPTIAPTRPPQHIYPGPPFPGGVSDFISNETNFLVAGNDINNPRAYGSPGVVYPDLVQGSAGTVADMTYGGGGNAIQHYEDAATGQRVVYAPMGLEALFPDWFAPPNTTNIIQFKNRRTELVHNTICWMRTGAITGRVQDTEAGHPLPGVLVRLVRQQTATGQPIAAYTALTDEQGNFLINGVEVASYEISAQKSGFIIQKRTWTWSHGGKSSTISFRMTKAEPATITGKVTRTDGTTPVVGATVKAVDNSDPKAVFTATTDSNGAYTIDRVPSETTYTLTASATGFGASIPVNYQVPDPKLDPGDTVVQPAKVYKNYDFQLKPEQGSVTGQVVDDATGTGIGGATVTATSGSQTVTATTDSSGNYSFDKTNSPANGLDPGTWALVATAPGYAPNSPAVQVTVVSSQNVVAPVIRLKTIPPGSISGTVTRTSDNSPLAGVLIQVKSASGAIVASATTTTLQTDPDGYTYNYRIGSVPAGVTYTVYASKSGFTSVPASQTASVASGVETKNVNFAMDPLHTFPATLSLVSAPYDYTGFDVGDLLSIPAGDRVPGVFLFATWDLARYVFYPTAPANIFRLGRGYFMAYKTNLPLSIQGTAADPTRPFDIALNPGWNLIGDPFNLDIDWTKVDVVVGGNPIPHDQAVAQGIIGNSLYTYISGGYALDFKLSAWKGYWVRAFQNCTLRVDPLNDLYGRAASVGTSRAVLQGGSGWSANLRVTVGRARDEDNYFGVSSRAVDGYDGFKAEKPPVFGDRYVYLTFDHEDWGDKSGGYGVDVRSASAAAKSWEFSVRTNVADSTASLTWPNTATVGRGVTLTLTDLATGAVRDMRSGSAYTWQTGDTPGVRRFRIDAAPAGRIGLRVTDIIARQAPNRAAGGVTISYNLSMAAGVEVRILSGSGSSVRRLTGRVTRAAGINQVSWDQKNDQGVALPSGAYLVEIRAQTPDGRQTVRSVAPVLIYR